METRYASLYLPWTIDKIDHGSEDTKHDCPVLIWVSLILWVIARFSGGDAPSAFLVLRGDLNRH